MEREEREAVDDEREEGQTEKVEREGRVED